MDIFDSKICSYLENRGIEQLPTDEKEKLLIIREIIAEHRNNFNDNVVRFLEKYEINMIPENDKEMIKVLYNIIGNEKGNIVLLDMKHASYPTEMTRDEFIHNIHNMEKNILAARGYIFEIRAMQGEEKQLKRKERFYKVKTLLKK